MFEPRQSAFIPSEFEKECKQYDLPCGVVFQFIYVEKLPLINAHKIQHYGKEKVIPQWLLPFAIEVDARRQDHARVVEANARAAIERQKLERSRAARAERLAQAQKTHPAIFPPG